ncbi:aminotransferase class V-fold PLP-dependent enzyme [Streptomyces angustmyceticus]|uniref:aminotransferase class V-fold PLP-dependent enzyme n=1 Tax=Streptomyces angustmyceticus TaxID=285578 RepID=UPI00344B5B0B
MTAPEGGPAALRKAARRARRLDARDPLAPFPGRFAPVPDGRLLLDGASLGRLPAATPALLDRVVRDEWGSRFARAGTQWRDLPQRIGDRMAEAVLGARPGEVVAGDCTSVNLYKLTAAALEARPGRRTVVVDDDNSPTDRHVVAGVAAERERALRTVHTHPDTGLDMATLRSAVDEDTAVVVLPLVSPRSGALLDMAQVHEVVHAQGALVLWDLSHAVGAVDLQLAATGADMAVAATYKHLMAGPGCPALLYVRRDLQACAAQPVHGWYGHREPFAARPRYDPDPTIRRFLTGTPPALSLAAAEPALDLLAEAGMAAVRAKSLALTGFLTELAGAVLEPYGLRPAGPAAPERRGPHVTYRHPRAGKLVPALAAAELFVDHLPPDRVRLSPGPLSTRFADLVEAVGRFRDVLACFAPARPAAEPGGRAS